MTFSPRLTGNGPVSVEYAPPSADLRVLRPLNKGSRTMTWPTAAVLIAIIIALMVIVTTYIGSNSAKK